MTSPSSAISSQYLDPEEVEALLRAVPDDALGPTERIVYLTRP